MDRQFQDRLRAWWQRISQRAKDKWWLWLSGALLEDRIVGGINAAVDSLALDPGTIATIKHAFATFDSIGLGFVGNLLALTILILIVHAYLETRSQSRHTPQQATVLPVEEDTPESYERKHQFRLFVEQEMQKVCHDIKWTMYQVNGQLGEKGGVYRYYVRALIYFMKPLEEAGTNLTNFLAARESLSNEDFIDAQKQLAQLYRIYEERVCWVRDLAWYTNPNIYTYSDYKNWKEADEKMRQALKHLLTWCPMLSEQIPQPSSIDPWWWEKTPSS